MVHSLGAAITPNQFKPWLEHHSLETETKNWTWTPAKCGLEGEPEVIGDPWTAVGTQNQSRVVGDKDVKPKKPKYELWKAWLIYHSGKYSVAAATFCVAGETGISLLGTWRIDWVNLMGDPWLEPIWPKCLVTALCGLSIVWSSLSPICHLVWKFSVGWQRQDH